MQAVVYRKLSELLDLYASSRRGRPEVWVKRLFQSLDWGERPTYSIVDDPGSGYQLVVDKTPIINVLVEAPNNIDRVYSALNKAYNQDVPWVVATDFKSLSLFGSYWYSFPHDVSSALALHVDHQQFLIQTHQLELLTPQEAASSRLQDLYRIYEGSRKRRIPLDMHLVTRMTAWRQLALESVKHPTDHADTLIHRLINSLFLIRYIEDMDETTNIPALQEISQGKNFKNELSLALRRVAERTAYNVPTDEELQWLDYAPIKSLVQQLYGYPEAGIIYDFSAMSVDILGRFYEEYLRWQVGPITMPTFTMTLFDPPEYELQNIRREKGIYFTPRYVVDYITRNLVGRYFAGHNGTALPTILDISCGSGTFLSASIDAVLDARPALHAHPSRVVETIVGLDNDPRAIEATRLNLTTKLLGEQSQARVPHLRLACHDLLFNGPTLMTLTNVLPSANADIIVGNPPYVRYESLINQYGQHELQNRFDTAEGRFDSYILFVEAALNMLVEGGLCGLVLPNMLLRSQAASSLREWLSKKSQILEIIDFMDQPVFPGVGAYVCLLLFRKRTPLSDEPQLNVTVARIYNLSNTPGSQLASISVAQPNAHDGIEVYRVPQPKGRAAWTLRNSVDTDLIELLDQKCQVTLSEIFDVRQGIKSGADKVFVIDGTITDKARLEVNGPVSVSIESGATLPLLRNRDMRRWFSKAQARIIYPYDPRTGQLYEWSLFERKFPLTAEYLTNHRKALEGRKSITNSPWYSLVRPREDAFRSQNSKLFISELSIRPLVCESQDSNTVIVGSTGGGSWLIRKKDDVDPVLMMAYLNSTVAEWYLRQICSMRQGGYILIEQGQLLKLPVPEFLFDLDSFARSEILRLSTKIIERLSMSRLPNDHQVRSEISKIEEQINSLVIEAVGLTASQGSYLKSRVEISRLRK